MKKGKIIKMYEEDIKLAKEVRLNACAPYSNYLVGAALRTKDGKVYLGCNIENHGIQSICAERVAFVKALSEGEKEFVSITIVGGSKGEDPNDKCFPCGYCREFISEYVDNDFKICVVENNNIIEYKVNDLLSNKFEL